MFTSMAVGLFIVLSIIFAIVVICRLRNVNDEKEDDDNDDGVGIVAWIMYTNKRQEWVSHIWIKFYRIYGSQYERI